ncbi:MAG: glycosyl transferase family 2 [Leptolyngbya foveolarum]|uniref:Glycosyl transferase family 2 n=1 Tax=Leptolyngbya foveolarum TaxID=47253 RepID=A0A2W4WP67_9CYAN|nr:MAG: glycosyl transferase family 2 [Leptolyngbya foveolarum]
MVNRLASIIIPCFNAEQWLSESIDSALKQTYSSVEIIVIDDGSSDGSLDIIKSYGDRIIWETGPNRGGNHARNRGFAISKGNYIQFLDADDYLLPQKLEKQIRFLETAGADVVYGDWRHQYHLENGKVILDDIKTSGNQPDILKSLLADWWVSPACLLFRRSAVESSGGWDETLSAGQDRDFFLAVVMSGAQVIYQPECDAIYRRYGNVTVSSASQERYLENHLKILEKYEARLNQEDKLLDSYKDALAQSYFLIARKYLETNPALYSQFLAKTLSLSPKFQAQGSERTFLYSFAQKLLSFRKLEFLVVTLKQLSKKLRNGPHNTLSA